MMKLKPNSDQLQLHYEKDYNLLLTTGFGLKNNHSSTEWWSHKVAEVSLLSNEMCSSPSVSGILMISVKDSINLVNLLSEMLLHHKGTQSTDRQAIAAVYLQLCVLPLCPLITACRDQINKQNYGYIKKNTI